jgi:hypothetical protein
MSKNESPELPVAGWYPDPEQVDTQRYWTGTEWTDQRAPLPPTKESHVGVGLALAILLPFVGFIFGVVMLFRGFMSGLGVMLLSMFSAGFWVLVILLFTTAGQSA